MSTVVEYTCRHGFDSARWAATRSAILDIARSQFGEHGFERTTIRSVASAAGVDPALVMHYFGSKAGLFAAVSRFEIAFPDLTAVAPDQVADVLLPLFITAWGPQGPFLPLLRAAATNRVAAEALLQVFVEQVAPALSAVVSGSSRRARRPGGIAITRPGGRTLRPRRPAAGGHGRCAAHRMATPGARALPGRSRTAPGVTAPQLCEAASTSLRVSLGRITAVVFSRSGW